MDTDTDMPFGPRLRAALGEPRRVRTVASSPRSHVWRIELSDGTRAVVKQLAEAPEAAQRYAREVAALRLAGRVGPPAGPPVVPRVLATDDTERVLVLEQVAHRLPVEGWEVPYAAALARLHAALTDIPADLDALPRWSGPTAADVDSFLTLARALGADPAPGVRDELRQLLHRLDQLPARPALLHGDPCFGNDLHTADGVRFIDFEGASIGNGLTELAYVRIGFPTCWSVTSPPEPLIAAAEAAYRSSWRDATGTQPQGDPADACVGWLIRGDALVQRAHRGTADQLARLPGEDWTWGPVSARQRVLHRLGVVGRMTADSETLGGLGRLSTGMAGRMRARWPDLRPVPARLPRRYRGCGLARWC